MADRTKIQQELILALYGGLGERWLKQRPQGQPRSVPSFGPSQADEILFPLPTVLAEAVKDPAQRYWVIMEFPSEYDQGPEIRRSFTAKYLTLHVGDVWESIEQASEAANQLLAAAGVTWQLYAYFEDKGNLVSYDYRTEGAKKVMTIKMTSSPGRSDVALKPKFTKVERELTLALAGGLASCWFKQRPEDKPRVVSFGRRDEAEQVLVGLPATLREVLADPARESWLIMGFDDEQVKRGDPGQARAEDLTGPALEVWTLVDQAVQAANEHLAAASVGWTMFLSHRERQDADQFEGDSKFVMILNMTEL